MVIKRLKSLFSKESGLKHEDLQKLGTLQDQQRADELHSLLYELAFQNAARFVHDELRRHESPFKNLQRDLFFNEILIMNFWMMEKVFLKYLGSMAEKMYSHYFGALSNMAERTAALSQKLKSYTLCWDEYTGHHDEFGLKVGETLFGKENSREREVSFWIISYADESMKKFRQVRKTLREREII